MPAVNPRQPPSPRTAPPTSAPGAATAPQSPAPVVAAPVTHYENFPV
ncbi:MAG TPA: energy transducer TonB, partial [Acidovorax defluvii]|nr:energy transducer TonB [Acidovorax defluvii]